MLDFCANATLQTMARGWQKRIVYVANDVRDRLGLSSVLVRPDGIVAWVGDGPLDEPKFSDVATRWFGDAESV